MGGSMGIAVGAAIVAGVRAAIADHCPYILFTAAGGARMQEGILSLMQMPRTTVALQELKEAGLPYIVVLTDPTTGGVTASYAMLGDVQIAEPGALIGFAGQRVIEQTIREKLPEGFQRAEYLLEHGMIDMVVSRGELKEKLGAADLLSRAGGERGRLMADFARSTNPEVQAQLDRLSKLSPAGDRLGLERIAALLERLGRPQDAASAGLPRRRNQRQGLDRSPSCARRWRRAATMFTPSPARTSCASTSGSASPAG